jgi:transketolase
MNSAILDLSAVARNIRRAVLKMSYEGKGAHISSCLSIVDILTVLYFTVLRIDPSSPSTTTRDRFILSKGHAVAALYATLAERGFFSSDLLSMYGKDNSKLPCHPEYGWIPGIEFSTGSLGHGLPVGCGLALGGRMDRMDYRVFVLLSDAECNEGSTWEAAAFAAHHDLDNLVVLLDYNKFQAYGSTRGVLNMEPMGGKWRSFGWQVVEVDGNDIGLLQQALGGAMVRFKPTIVICHTTAGHGVSFTQNQLQWHYRNLNTQLYDQAIGELS